MIILLTQLQLGENLLGLNYLGGNNPLARSEDYTYSHLASDMSEYTAIDHDKRCDNLEITRLKGLLTDIRAIGANWKFGNEELNIASGLS